MAAPHRATRDPALEAIREALDPRRAPRAWHGGATPLGALRGVRAETAAWVPAPGRSSIWALTLHLAYWKYAVRRRLSPRRLSPAGKERFRRHPANFPMVPADPGATAWRRDVELLRDEHVLLVRAVEALPASRLGQLAGDRRRFTNADLIAGIAMHDAYHTGQIQLLKRLWETRRRRG